MSSRSSEQVHSRWFDIIAFLSLTDTEVLAKSGRYDRMLAYAMVFRQLVTFAFTFMLFAYGVSLFVGTTGAVIAGLVFAMTLFFLDQAIIGSDWALRNPFKGGLPIRTLLGLVPRILYSLIIAYGLATLAEISLQADAIDEQIQKDVAQNNQEYFSRMQAYEEELDTAVVLTEQRIQDTVAEIQSLREEQTTLKVNDKEYDQQTIANSVDNQQSIVNKVIVARDSATTELTVLNERLVQTRKDYDFWFNEALLERTGQDGRAPTEGPKYRRAVATYTDLTEQIPLIQSNIDSVEARLLEINAELDQETLVLNDLQQIQNTLDGKEQVMSENQTALVLLQQQLQQSQIELTQQIDNKQTQLAEYKQKLQADGLFYEQKTGVLSRFLALKSLHADPELGQAALMFSYLLKIFFVAIELMPVIIKLFFSPFSFYSLRMYRKMQEALLVEKLRLEELERAYMSKSGRKEPVMSSRPDDDYEGKVLA
ncbi:DUF4407 domain-containing protein [Marinicella sp. W31]|uniref:DUF4407 domain-containing protein n=1 Tax=Marinicella sp. W31 TaxID=3023713 RepID=UPI0037575804